MLQAVDGQQTGNWVLAKLTDQGLPPDTASVSPQSVAFTQSLALPTLFAIAGNTPTQYDIYLTGPNDGLVTDRNGAIATNAIVPEASLTEVNFVGGGGTR